MRTLAPKALLTAFNPSPVFEAVAIFAERLVLNGDESKPSEIDAAYDFAVPSGENKLPCFLKKTGSAVLRNLKLRSDLL